MDHSGNSKLKFFLFSGKGGVGKTTCAAATALHFAEQGKKTLLFSTDPAHSLSDSLGQRLGDEITAVRGIENLAALELNAEKMLEKFKQDYNEEIINMLVTTTYLDEADIDEIYSLPLPGLDEMMGLKQIMDFIEDNAYDLYIWDTAPTGHTLRLLALPELLDVWVKVFARIRWKYKYIVGRFSGKDVHDATDDFFLMLKKLIHRVVRFLRTPARSRFIAVTIPEAMAVNETKRMLRQLNSMQIPVRHLIVNNVIPENNECSFCTARRKEQQKYIALLREEFKQCQIIEVNRLMAEVRGLANLQEFAKYLYQAVV
ncbi:ArsA family ATPase [Calderihabitans maritimus]|uniref:ATPase n=1 Tax=Calderihabitans maritimus TaxID=1246530 RepID=A0A1Z5HWR4_9FIRM|nr:ArsA family ATPase [Calderihabitans maritimus]GAW93969.1 ATPase [Calderihabitans maritimus]